MRVLDLFSGVGGFSLGLERAGFQTVAFCEVDAWCRRVLTKHWPDVPIFQNVKTLRGEDVGPVDVICGGYPCQPFSVAGQRKGQEDDRHLWPEFMRIVAELRPTWVIGENVAGHISMGLDDVLSDLEAEGYACRSFVIPACAVNARHRRDRVWTIGHANGNRQSDGAIDGKTSKLQVVANAARQRVQKCWATGQQEPETHAGQGISLRGCAGGGSYEWPPEPGVGRNFNGVSCWLDGFGGLSIAAKKRAREILRDLWSEGFEEALWQEVGRYERVSEAQILLSIVREYQEKCDNCGASMEGRAAARECLRKVWCYSEPSCTSHRREYHKQYTREYTNALRELSRKAPPSFTPDWQSGGWEIGIKRVAHGVPHRVDRIRGLGNAVVPQVVEMIGRHIIEAQFMEGGKEDE